jgi:hypothetical protein
MTTTTHDEQRCMNKGLTVPAQVHRYGDLVAVWIGGGATRYLAPSEAKLLSLALLNAAVDCETTPFTKSGCGTVELQFG